MEKNTANIKKLLTENNYEVNFKEYMDKINNIFGDDYASIVLTCDKDVEKSLKMFSSKFSKLNTINIESIIIQSAILSKKNYYHKLFNKRRNEDFWFEFFLRIKDDMLLKKALIREFIKDCNKKNLDLFYMLKSKEEKAQALYNLYQLKKYEKALSIQVEHKRRAIKTYKKGNYR